ncbi:MAG: CAP domain-containing protein [Patescibacteria group bacterium]|nr:CAP domain-containing protein [Patescibacteria group bacterium]
MVVPHRGNAFRPHALQHSALSLYLFGLMVAQVAFGVTLYSGPAVMGANTEALRNNVIVLSNMERQKNGVSALFVNDALNEAAEEKLNDMFDNNYWDHVGPAGETAWDFIAGTGYRYEVAGENLARGFESPEKVVNAWMSSPTHRENILNARFQEIGLAVGSGKIKGGTTTVIVQLFGRPQTAFASQRSSTVLGEAKLIPELDTQNATLPSRSPYFFVWALIFGLIVLDGVMLRKLGLHTSRKHLLSFRVSLAMSAFMLLLLSIGITAII